MQTYTVQYVMLICSFSNLRKTRWRLGWNNLGGTGVGSGWHVPCTGIGEMAALFIQSPLQEEYVLDVVFVQIKEIKNGCVVQSVPELITL